MHNKILILYRFLMIIFSCFFSVSFSFENTRTLFLEQHKKLAALSVLVEEQSQKVRSLMQKIIEYVPAVKEKTRQRLAQKMPQAEITDELIQQEFTQELTQFGYACSSSEHQGKKQIANDQFFPNVNKPLDIEHLMFKYYVAQHSVELLALCALIDEWEELKQEMIPLYVVSNE